MFAVVFAAAARWVGPTAANVAVGFTAASPILLPFAVSVYWCPFLFLGPFTAARVQYPRAVGSPRQFAAFLGFVVLLISDAAGGWTSPAGWPRSR